MYTLIFWNHIKRSNWLIIGLISFLRKASQDTVNKKMRTIKDIIHHIRGLWSDDVYMYLFVGWLQENRLLFWTASNTVWKYIEDHILKPSWKHALNFAANILLYHLLSASILVCLLNVFKTDYNTDLMMELKLTNYRWFLPEYKYSYESKVALCVVGFKQTLYEIIFVLSNKIF